MPPCDRICREAVLFFFDEIALAISCAGCFSWRFAYSRRRGPRQARFVGWRVIGLDDEIFADVLVENPDLLVEHPNFTGVWPVAKICVMTISNVSCNKMWNEALRGSDRGF